LRKQVFGAAAVLVIAASVLAGTPVLGHITFPTSGSSRAQPAFLRGVLLLHSFEYDDAIGAFREAQSLDPGFAMAYWGEAMCYNQPLWRHEDLAKARETLARLAPTPAARAAKAPTDREKAYLDAVETLFGPGDATARAGAYAGKMKRLMQRYPDDDEASVFAALAMLGTIPEGERNPQISLAAGAIASRVLDRNPDHPGAAHVMLHAYDDGEHAAMGLKAARIYAKIAPASSHALHMPSHVFLPLGMWDEAARSDEASFQASLARVRQKHLSIAQADFHPLTWLHYECLQQGRFKKAASLEDTVRQAIAASPAATATVHAVESEIGRGFNATSLKSELASMRARSVIESGEWKRMKGAESFDNIDELFALGYSAVRLGDEGRAEAALDHLLTASTTLPEKDAREIADIMAAELTGALQVARGDSKTGLPILAKAVELEANRPGPVGKPYPVKPAAELYGELLLAKGDARRAIDEFHRSLARTPNRPASLLGLARAAKETGDLVTSRRAARRLVEIWHQADSGAVPLAEAQHLLR
jgi:tetratricopeptide (TPR) repeat protein